MNKHIVEGFIIVIIILFGVSIVAEFDNKSNVNNQIDEFEDKVSKQEEIDNGNIEDVRVIKEDSSNLISNVNASIATFIVNGLNDILKFGIKLIDGITN